MTYTPTKQTRTKGKGSKITDPELLERIHGDDYGVSQEAWDILRKRHAGILYRHALRKVNLLGRKDDIEDMLSYANEGFVRAVKTWRDDGGASFSTYLWKCVSQCVAKYNVTLHRGSIYVPPNARDNKDEHTLEDIERAKACRGIGRLRIVNDNDEGGKRHTDVLELVCACSDKDIQPDYQQVQTERDRLLRHILGRIDERHCLVLVLRAKGWKLMEIGRKLGISKERVRQLEEKGLRTLRELAKGEEYQELRETYGEVRLEGTFFNKRRAKTRAGAGGREAK